MERFCLKCGWWQSEASDKCKKEHLNKKKENKNETK